jgi:hypothetical protein
MAGEAAESGLRFFLDRGLGAYVVPGALRAAGWMLETMDERYGADQSQNVQDTQWIEEATLAGDVLLCKDLAIAQNPLEAQVVYMTSARVFGPVQCIDHRSDDGAVVPGQRSKDRESSIEGSRTIRHGGESGLGPAQGQACLSTGLISPAPTRHKRPQQLAVPSARTADLHGCFVVVRSRR